MKIEIITNCPSCGSDLEQVNSQLFCRNVSCPAQSVKKIEAFAKKMKIKGLGPASIQKLELESVLDIYFSTEDTLIEVLGEKVGTKVFKEIQNSKNVRFSTLVSALSIPLIGDTAAKKVAVEYNSFRDIMEGSNELPLGEKASDNLFGWLLDNEEMALELDSLMSYTAASAAVEQKGSVCITGKLKDFSNRNSAKEILESHGYTVTSSVSSKTAYLVDEEGKPSSKRKKAENLNIPIVSIDFLINK